MKIDWSDLREFWKEGRPGYGICLSGGGHRASLFALGGLLYLVDSGEKKKVATIASVSGGSVTSAFVAQECDFRHVEPDEFEEVARKLIARITSRHVASPFSLAGVLYLISIVLAVGLVPALVQSWALRLALGGGLLFLLLLARGRIVELLLRRAFFTPDGKVSRLGNLRNATTDHVLCATDLAAARPVYFYCSHPEPIDGYMEGRNLTLAAAVRASAALPGLVTPRLLLRWFERSGGTGRKPRLMVLGDGGIWNNLGTQFFEQDQMIDPASPPKDSWRIRKEESPNDEGKPRDDAPPAERNAPNSEPGHVCVIDGSGLLRTSWAWPFVVPLLNELRAFLRVFDLLYINTVRPRMRALHEGERSYWRFGDAFDPDWDLPAAVATLSYRDRPLAMRWGARTGLGFPQTEHAQACRKRMEKWKEYEDEEVPEPIFKHIPGFADLFSLLAHGASVKTRFERVSPETAAALLAAGYLRTMAAMYVGLDAPLVRPFPAEKFESLVGCKPPPEAP